MLALGMMLSEAPFIFIRIGSLQFSFTLSQIISLAIAALVGLVAEFVVGWRLPFGIIGAIVAALAGMWLLTNFAQLVIPNDPDLYGVRIFRALTGAILLVVTWHLLTYRLWHRRPRYYERKA